MGNSHWSGSIVSAAGISAAGTIRAGGTFTTTRVTASSSLVTAGGVSAAGTLRAVGGFGFVAGDYKKFAAGTYIGVGGATTPIRSTGLTTISGVYMVLRRSTVGTATQAVAMPRPCIAHGTPGSFYPQWVRMNGLNAAFGLAASATTVFFAVGT